MLALVTGKCIICYKYFMWCILMMNEMKNCEFDEIIRIGKNLAFGAGMLKLALLLVIGDAN